MGIFLCLRWYIYSKYIYWECGRKGGEHLYFPCGDDPLPNELVSQYGCVNLPETDDNDRTHENDERCKCPSLRYGQCFFLGKCFIGPIQVKHAWGRGGQGAGALRTYFFSLHPWKFLKENSTPGNLVQLCMLHALEISRSKTNQDPLKFYFFFGLPWIFLVVFNYPNSWKFCILFLEHPWKFYILNHVPTCLDFFQNCPISNNLG